MMLASSHDLISALAAVVGEEHVLVGEEEMRPYTTEWRRNYPGTAYAVVRPGNTAEVSAVVALCSEAGIAIVPQGGNTGLVGGSTPDNSGQELVLSLGRMKAVRKINASDNTMTLEAGCTVLEAQDIAASHKRLFPLSLGSEGSATIGGVISTNAGGEQVLRYGNTRELTLGLEVVLHDGRILNLLSDLRKDNTGYDLRNLFIGAEGTLGVVTAATFRLFALPRTVLTVWVAVQDPQSAVLLLALLTEAVGERVTAFELIGREALDQAIAHAQPGMRDPLAGNYPWAVLFDVSETSAEVDLTSCIEQVLEQAMESGVVQDAALAASGKQAQDFWKVREHIPEAQVLDGPSIKHDISVPVSLIPAFISRAGEALDRLMPGIRVVCFGHVGDGNLHYNQSKPHDMPADAFRFQAAEVHAIVHAVAAELDGSISAEHGVGRFKQEAFLRYEVPEALTLMRAIKNILDPQEIFNPGRVLPRMGNASNNIK